MRDEKLADRLCNDVSDWLILAVRLSKIERHQHVQILAQAFWLDQDDLFHSGEEHVLKVLRLLDQLKHFLEEEVGVSD